MKEPYFVEVDNNGCSRCGEGRTYTVIQPDGCGISQSFSDVEDAEHLAEMLNDAYQGKWSKSSAEWRRQLADEEALHADSIRERDEFSDAFDQLAAALGVETEYSNNRSVQDVLQDCLEEIERRAATRTRKGQKERK